MPTRKQLTGMRGVYLVASELSRLGFIASPTSRSAIGADILVTDPECARTYSVQVKTNASTFSFWLLSGRASTICSPSHIYVFVNIRANKKRGEIIEYFVVPSEIVASNIRHTVARSGQRGDWYDFRRSVAVAYKDHWQLFDGATAKSDLCESPIVAEPDE